MAAVLVAATHSVSSMGKQASREAGGQGRAVISGGRGGGAKTVACRYGVFNSCLSVA